MIGSFLAGVIVATAGSAVGSHLITGAEVKDGSIGWKDLTKGVRAKMDGKGRQGPRGRRGPRGRAGSPGADGIPGPPGPGPVRAYAYVSPICLGCAPGVGYTPLDASRSKNISLGTVAPGAPPGTWCFVLGEGIDPSTVTVLTSIVDRPLTNPEEPLFETAEWVPTQHCQNESEIEVHTVDYYETEEGGLFSGGNPYIHFSLIVP